MKVIIVLSVVIVLAKSDDWKPASLAEYGKIADSCFASEKIPQESIDALKTRDYPKQPGCYYRCDGIKSGVWDDKSGYDATRTDDMLAVRGLKATESDLKKCMTDKEKNSDPCVWSANIVKCMYDNKLVTKV